LFNFLTTKGEKTAEEACSKQTFLPPNKSHERESVGFPF